MLSGRCPQPCWYMGSVDAFAIPARRWIREFLTAIALAAVIAVPQASIGCDGGASFAAQTEPKRQLHYKLIMSEDDAICRPLLGLYNKMLNDAITALELHHNVASIISDFDVVEPERFETIGFQLPPIEMGGGAAGIYRADVFDDGHPRSLLMAISSNQPIMGAYVIILKKGMARDLLAEVLKKASDGSLTNAWLEQNDAADMNMNFLEWPVPRKYKKYDIPRGYLLVKWPHLDDLLERWAHRPPRSWPFLPVINFATTNRVFVHGNGAYFITNEYIPIANPKIVDSIVWIYKMWFFADLCVCREALTRVAVD